MDADLLARKVIEPDSVASGLLRKKFGSAMFHVNGTLNRNRLGALIFDNSEARQALEKIIHPLVRSSIDSWFNSLKQNKNNTFGVADIPLLFETQQENEFDFIILTNCSQEVQLSRLMKRDKLPKAAALKRISAQLPASAKIPFVDFVIQTERTFGEIDKHAFEILHELKQKTRST